MDDLVVYLICLGQIAAYAAAHYFIRQRFASRELATPINACFFFLYTAPVLGLLATEAMTPYSMTKQSLALIGEYFFVLFS